MAAKGSDATSAPVSSNGYKAAVLSLLLAAYTFNFIDRTIVSTISQAIQVDLKVTNAQMGLLGGLYFALLYTFLGIPIARLAERKNRVTIITVSVVIWSGFTALCGTASSFAQLALYRFGVGVGEAGCSPPSHSLVSDYFPPKQRATALSVYSFGIPLGTMFGAVIGGWLAQNFSWRIAFVIVGLPGLLLALILKTVVKEPPRGHSETETPATAYVRPKFTLPSEIAELGKVTWSLFGAWPVLNMILGVTIASFGSYGAGAFVPSYFIRAFHLDLASVGLIVGLVGGFSSGIGTLAGGFVTDWAGKHSPAWYALTPGIGLLICTPIYIFAYLQPTWQGVALLLLIPGIFHYTYLAPTFAVVQNSVPPHRRATATALMFFFLNLIALGGGPPFTGWLIDHIAGYSFAHPQVHGVLDLASGAFTQGGGVDFNHVCPGGKAPKGAAAALVKACGSTNAQASQAGIIISVCFYAWAGVHYLLGAIGLVKHMRIRAANLG